MKNIGNAVNIEKRLRVLNFFFLDIIFTEHFPVYTFVLDYPIKYFIQWRGSPGRTCSLSSNNM